MSKELSPYYEETSDGYKRLSYEEVVEDLQKEIQELNNRISKAIKYIDKSLNNIMCYERGALINTRKILKGVDKE